MTDEKALVTPSPETPLTFLYDGACPLCSREICWYRQRQADETITWVDLSRCDDAKLPENVDRTQAMARFHVIQGDGRALSGAAAFARLWDAYPGLRQVARLTRLPGIEPLLEWGYRRFLSLRQKLVRLFPASRQQP